MNTIKLISKKQVVRFNNAAPGWKEIGEQKCYFRSKAEYRYALYLQWLEEQGEIVRWEHEPETFYFEKIKRGTRSYLPDFLIFSTPNDFHYVEVKGWMDPKSATKLKRMAKYYPDIEVRVIDTDWFKKNTPLLKGLLKGWDL